MLLYTTNLIEIGSMMIKTIIIVSIILFIINIFFGYLRGNLKKLTFLWWVYLHVPIFIEIIIRKMLGIDRIYIILFLVILIIGQKIGVDIKRKKFKRVETGE